jgi:hypothetical protein
MSLQAIEAVLCDMDKEKNILKETTISVDLESDWLIHLEQHWL